MNLFGTAVMNFTDKNTPYTRKIEHRFFNISQNYSKDFTYISNEYPSKWQIGDEPYYPINDEKNNFLFEKYNELSKLEEKIKFTGRLGLYKYLDMDDVIESALNTKI